MRRLRGGGRPVKRSRLERKTPLARGDKPLKRGKPLNAGGSSLKRSGGLAPMSDARRAQLPARAVVRAAVFERDNHQCRIAPLLTGEWSRCFGRLTAHHLKKESQGGNYTMGNLISACVFHNDWVEDQPELARQLGLVR